MNSNTNTVPHPITLSDPTKDVVPHAYTIVKQSQHCKGCGTLHEWSELYAKTHLRSQLNAGKYVTNLRPIRDPREIQYNLPIEVVIRPMQVVPFCHECYQNTSLSHLLPPPIAAPSPRTGPSWAGVGPAKPEKPKPPTAVRTKPTFTIDDL